MLRAVTVVAVLAVGLAGCIGAPSSDGAASTSPVPIARQPGVDDPRNVTVHVVDPTGGTNASVEGARVMFFTNVVPEDHTPAPYFEDLRNRFGNVTVEDGPLEVLAEGTTGPEGRIVGRIDPGAVQRETHKDHRPPLGVAVGGLDGYTTEVYAEVLEGIGGPCGLNRIELDERPYRVAASVYPSSVPFDVEGRLDASAAAPETGTFLPGPEWWPTEVLSEERPDWGTFHDTRMSRLSGAEARLTWSNGGGDWADLYLGVGRPGDDDPDRVGDDERQGPLAGDNVERIDVPVDSLAFEVAVGPVTDQPVGTATGIDYRITGNLTFTGSDLSLSAD